MRYIYMIFLIMGSTWAVHAQQHDDKWIIGLAAPFPIGSIDSTVLLDFDENTATTPTLTKIQRNLPADATFASICDSMGNLLFYTNGVFIHDASFQMMQNGDSLNFGYFADTSSYAILGYSIAHGALIIPKPNSSIYYLFHQFSPYIPPTSVDFAELRYTIIDMSLNNGLGGVVGKNILLKDSVCMGQLKAVKHANGEDWWIVCPMFGEAGFYRFLLTNNGIESTETQIVGNGVSTWRTQWGQASFSHDGHKYARYDYYNDLDIFDFDRCTGLFSNHLHIGIQDTSDILWAPVGLAFSPNSRFLYVSSYSLVYQYDMQETNIIASLDTVAVYLGHTCGAVNEKAYFINALLAPNNKIYIQPGPSTSCLHVINSPDEKGDACQFENLGQDLLGVFNATAFPNFPHYRTPALPVPCLSTTVPQNPIVSSFKVYPNPVTQGIVQLEWEAKQANQILIVDALGRCLGLQHCNTSDTTAQFDVSYLPNGFYAILLKNDNMVLDRAKLVLLR